MNEQKSDKIPVRPDLLRLFDKLETPVVEWDANGVIVYANTRFADLARRSVAGLVGHPFYETLFPGSLLDQWDQARLLFVRSKAVANYATALQDGDGQNRSVLWTTVLKTAESGRLLSVVGFCVEITMLMMATMAIGELADKLQEAYGFVAPNPESQPLRIADDRNPLFR